MEFVDLLKDAKRVILSFGSTIERAPLQTYGAVLFFSPLASKVRETFWNQRMPSWDAIQGVKQDWDAYLQSLEGHNGRICKRAMAFSPDSQVIAAGISDDTVQLWSTTTGATLQTLEGHAGVVEAVAFSNNETLASASLDGTIRIWHLPTGKLLHTLNHPHDSVTAMVFLPDGEHLATASKLTPEYGCEVSVRLWNLKTAAPPEELFQNSGHVFKQVVFSPDSQLMASNNGGTIEVWSFPAGSHRCTLEDPRGSVDNMVISPDNQFLGHISLTSTIRLWNIEDGQHLYEIREGYEEHLVAVAFTPDGRFLASASWSPEKVKMWDLETGAHHHTISGTESRISETVAFSPDSQLLATVGSSGAAIKLWDVDMQTQQHPSNVIEPTGDGLRQLFPSKDIIRVIYSPDGQLAATGAYDRTARLWDVSTGSCLRVLGDHDNWVHDVAFSPDGKLLASFDDSVRIWNVEDGTLQQNIDKKTGLIIAAEYSADGRLAAAASADTVTLYNAATGAELFTLEGHSNTSGQVVFSPDSQLLASVSGGEICLWETSTGMLRHVLRSERTGSDDYQLVFSPDSQSLASVHLKFTVLWDVVSGAPQQTLMYEVDAIAFSPDHQLVAMHVNSFGEPTVTEIRSVTTGKSWHTDETPDCLATDILFSPDGQILALAAKDRSVWLLGVTTHEHFVIIKNPHDFVTRLKFSPDGQTLATSSQDKTVRLWDTTTGAHIHVFEYGTGFVRGIDFSPEAGLVVSESSHEGAWSSNLFSPMTLKVHKFPLTTAARQIGTSEFHTPGISLDVDQDWIIKDSKRLLWLPTEYRPGWPAVWAKRGSMILIGCDSGQLLRVQGI